MFNKFFRLNQYTSTELKSPLVEAYFQQVMIAIGCQATFDWVMWYFALVFAMHSSFLAAVLATVIVMGVVQLDLQIVKADDSEVSWKKRWGSMTWRFAFTLIVATITSVPLELNWFSSEITHRLETAQKLSIDKIRKDAMTQEKDRIDGEIKDVSAQLATEASATQGNAVADLKKYEDDRAETRKQQVTKQKEEEEKILGAIKEKEDVVLAESAGTGVSGKPKCGPTCKNAQAQADAWREQLNQKKVKDAQGLIDFDDETQGHLVALRAKRDTTTEANQKELKGRLDTLRKERKDKVEELRKMEPEKVASLYGGNFQKEFGFQDRYDTLENMRKESPAVNWTIWACRVISAIMGFLVLGLAMSKASDVQRFYSQGAQALAGDPYSKKVVNGMGYKDLENFALTPKARTALTELFGARQDLWEIVMELEQKLVSIVIPDERTGLYPSKLRIEGIVHSLWVQKGAEAMKKLGKKEEEVRRTGQNVPQWPTDKLGPDPRTTNVWKIDDRRLTSFGWESPEEIVTAGKLGLKNLIIHRLMLRKRIEEMEVGLQEKISGNPVVTFEEIRRGQALAYRNEIVPVLHDLRYSEDAVLKAHYQVPEWPQDFTDPREGLYQRLCLISESELREKYDWKGVVATGTNVGTAEA